MPDTIIALVATLFGGVGLKVVEHWLSRSSIKIEDRRSYRDEIIELNDRIDKEEKAVAEWRKKYFEAEEANHRLRVQAIRHGLEVPED